MTSDDEQESSIGAIAKRRFKQDDNFAYLGYSIPTTLLYLTSGELIRVITDDNYWKYFNNYFPTTKEIIRTKLDEISNIRNALAHFRPIKKSDVDLLKTNAIHTLTNVQQLLSDVVNSPDIVPTNTNEAWYEELNSLNNERIKIRFKQSKDGNWIKITLSYIYPILRIDSENKWSLRHNVLNLKSIPILKKFTNLRNYLIYMSYDEPSDYTDLHEPDYIKKIHLTFSRDTLNKKHLEIKKDISELFKQINEEVEMISLDTLARGEFIESLVFNGEEQDFSDGQKYYKFDVSASSDYIKDNNIAEFWGTFNYVEESFVSNASSNPWMPNDISDDKSLPF